MYLKKKSLGLILGGGQLTQTLIKNCKKNKIKFYIISIDDDFNLNNIKPDIKINYNNLGDIFGYLKKKNINQVVFLGSIKKIPLLKIRPNLITIIYLLKIIFLYNRGDGKLIDKIIKIFESKNINILDPRIFLKDNLCSKKFNNLIKFKKFLNIRKIKEYFNMAKNFGSTDKGQAIIICDGNIVLEEDANGTDYLIKSFKFIKQYKFSCLVKVSKPQQDIRVDLPTIGPKTIENMVLAGINAIIVEHQKTFIESPKTTFSIINKNNILFYAV